MCTCGGANLYSSNASCSLAMVRLEKLTFAGLFSYAAESTVRLSNRTVVVGPNNAGKSNIFRIIRILADAFYHRKRLLASEMSQLVDKSSISAEISLSPAEADRLVDVFACGEDNDPRLRMIHMPNRKKIAGSLDRIIVNVAWEKIQDGSGDNTGVEIQFPKCGFGCKSRLNDTYFEVVPYDERPYTKNSATTIQLNEFVVRIFEDGDPKGGAASFFSSSDSATHRPVPRILENLDRMDPELRSKIRDLVNYLGIDESAAISLPRVLGTILTRGIVHATENRNLLQDKVEETFLRLSLPVYEANDFGHKYNLALIERLQTDRLEHAGVLEHDGGNIAQFLFSLKNSPRRSDTVRYQTIKEQFKRLFDAQGLTIEPILEHRVLEKSSAIRTVTPIPHIAVVSERLPEHLRLSQVSSGARGVIYMLAAVHGTRNSIVMLDEPGINMHPTMLQAVVNGMGGQNSDNQILVVTHSPDLLRYELHREDADIIYVRNVGNQSKLFQAGAAMGQVGNDHVGIALKIDPEVFFAECVILVEGKSDRALLELADVMAAKDSKYDLPLNNIAVVSVGGKRGFPSHIRLLDEYRIQWVILADEDASKDPLKRYKASWISEGGVEGEGPIYLIKDDLEALMEKLDPDIYDKVDKKSKVTAAIEFVQMLQKKNPGCVPSPIVEFLDQVVERAKSRAR